MSTLQRVNFEPVSDILATQRKSFGLADPGLADPNNANPFVDGEWFVINDEYTAAVAASRAGAGKAAAQTSYVVFNEKGRSDVQATSERKVSLIWMGDYEADTRIFDAAVSVVGGAPIASVGQPLKVATITISGLVKVGLVGMQADGSDGIVVARVTRLPSANGGKLRYRTASGI